MCLRCATIIKVMEDEQSVGVIEKEKWENEGKKKEDSVCVCVEGGRKFEEVRLNRYLGVFFFFSNGQ